jgi:hypothetical protein
LAHQSQDMLLLLVAVWRLLRPVIMERQAEPPRIWAT